MAKVKVNSNGLYVDGEQRIPMDLGLKRGSGHNLINMDNSFIDIYSSSKEYGLLWSENTDSYHRLGSMDFTQIQRQMKRCLLKDDGTVYGYLHPNDSTKMADGSDADITGANGQVMVEIPKFWYKYEYIDGTHKWMISPVATQGYDVHSAFVLLDSDDNTVIKDYIYVGAYATNIGDYKSVLADSSDRSVDGNWPQCSKTRDDCRQGVRAIGTGWNIQDFNTLSAVQILYLIEYGTFNSQAIIGAGRTQLHDGSWAKESYWGINGRSNRFGNHSGCINSTADADDDAAKPAVMSYRGIEDFYGNVWTFVDGINIKDNVPYVSNKPSEFADDKFDDSYVSVGITMPSGNGWQDKLAGSSKGLLPAAVGANDSTKITDYYWQNSGNRIMFSGSDASSGMLAGAFALHAAWAASDSAGDVSARSQYK